MARGNRRQAVFLDNGDYEIYLDRLAAYRTRYGVALYAYC
jgi:putative transposase